MITLQEIFDRLTFGDLSHIALGGAALGQIESKNYPHVINCLNGALTALHKRFLLRTAEITVQQIVGITTYYLRKARTISTGTLPKYILDTVDNPYTEDLFKIESILNASRVPFIINDASISVSKPVYDQNSVIIQTSPIYTPAFDTIFLTPADPVEQFIVQYRANYPRILITDTIDPTAIEVNISDAYIDALSLSIAARVYTPLTSGDGQMSAASIYAIQYEAECKRLENEGMAIEDRTEPDRFERNGWV